MKNNKLKFTNNLSIFITPCCKKEAIDDTFGFNPPIPECPKCGKRFPPDYK